MCFHNFPIAPSVLAEPELPKTALRTCWRINRDHLVSLVSSYQEDFTYYRYSGKNNTSLHGGILRGPPHKILYMYIQCTWLCYGSKLNSGWNFLTYVNSQILLSPIPDYSWIRLRSKKDIENQPTILDKNVKKNAPRMFNFRIYFPPKSSTLKILLPPPPPKKKQCWGVIGTSLLLT